MLDYFKRAYDKLFRKKTRRTIWGQKFNGWTTSNIGSFTNSQFPTDLHDKNGEILHEDDVIYDGKNHYHIYWNELHPQVEGFSPICGYIHNLTQKELSLFVRVGTMNEIQDWCDERL